MKIAFGFKFLVYFDINHYQQKGIELRYLEIYRETLYLLFRYKNIFLILFNNNNNNNSSYNGGNNNKK